MVTNRRLVRAAIVQAFPSAGRAHVVLERQEGLSWLNSRDLLVEVTRDLEKRRYDNAKIRSFLAETYGWTRIARMLGTLVPRSRR